MDRGRRPDHLWDQRPISPTARATDNPRVVLVAGVTKSGTTARAAHRPGMPGLLIHGAALLLACHKEQSVLVVADAGNQRIVRMDDFSQRLVACVLSDRS